MGGLLPSSEDGLHQQPAFLTGFLDYGDFHGSDLQYTFSAQLSSTNPPDDWKNFFHPFAWLDGDGKEESTRFMISLRNYGPPYEVVVNGVSVTTPISVCLYEYETNNKLGCVQGTTKEAGHILIDSISETLKPCNTYFALANATLPADEGKSKRLWSSTSVTWNGPCSEQSSNSMGKSPEELVEHIDDEPSEDLDSERNDYRLRTDFKYFFIAGLIGMMIGGVVSIGTWQKLINNPCNKRSDPIYYSRASNAKEDSQNEPKVEYSDTEIASQII